MTYQEVEAEYRRLQQQVKAGELTEEDLRARLEVLMIEDDQGRWWIIGYETGQWYYHDGEKWVRGEPSALAQAVPESQESGPPALVQLAAPSPAVPVRPATEIAGAAAASSVVQPVPQPSQPVRKAEPPAGAKRRSPVLAGVLAVVIVGVLAVVAYLVFGRNPASPVASLAGTPTPQAVVVAPTPTPEPALPTETEPAPTLEEPSPIAPPPSVTPVPPTATPTEAATATLSPTPVPPTATDTAEPEPTQTPAPRPTLVPTRRLPVATIPPVVVAERPAIPGMVADFEKFGTWVRGNEPYGTFTQNAEVKHGGASSARLAYDFPAVRNNYVVFQARPPITLSGRPATLTIWVYGDGSEHYLNAWIQDSAGEVRQFTFGRISHRDTWQQMTLALDTKAPWPQGSISGRDNGQLDYPISLRAIVLDAVPREDVAYKGVIYLDDLMVGGTAGQ